MKAKLSHQREKIAGGLAPLPVYTCLHVKTNISAKVFQEWYEFTPFEVAIPKYGVSVAMRDFASKFYNGALMRRHPEVPLHYLYGVWGSAFTILFKRLVQEKGRNCEMELIRMITGKTHEVDEDEGVERDLGGVGDHALDEDDDEDDDHSMIR